MSFENLARPNVTRMHPYVPGKPIEEIQADYGLEHVVKLASNENPIGPPASAVKAMREAAEKMHFYPEGGSLRLRSALAAKHDIDPSCVVIGSGSDELISILARVFLDKGDEIVVAKHAFVRYKMAGDLREAVVVEVPMVDYTHDLDAMKAAVTDKTKILFVANPNNPTGTYVTEEQFAAFMDGVPSDKLVIMDEAYYEYAAGLEDYPDSLDHWRRGRRNLVILRTFSKTYALAGLRVGYAFADPSVIGLIDRIRPPFNLTSMAQAAAEAALGDEAYLEKSIEMNRTNRQWLCEQLDRRGVSYVPSMGNFVLVATAKPASDVFESLLAKGVIVRPMAGYGFPNHVRVTIGTREELDTFLTCFDAVEGRP